MMILSGLLGGMGPKASAFFLNSLYAYPKNIACEQEFPRVVMLSDPTISDRTTLLLDGRENDLLKELCYHLDYLEKMNVDKIYMLCFTAHYFQKNISEKYKNFASLVDLGLKDVVKNKQKVLLLCSKATYYLQIFQKSSYWQLAEPYVIIPNEQDEESIHHILYEIKVEKNIYTVCSRLNHIIHSYNTKYALAGCTELHILTTPLFQKSQNLDFFLIDPLQSLIEEIWNM